MCAPPPAPAAAPRAPFPFPPPSAAYPPATSDRVQLQMQCILLDAPRSHNTPRMRVRRIPLCKRTSDHAGFPQPLRRHHVVRFRKRETFVDVGDVFAVCLTGVFGGAATRPRTCKGPRSFRLLGAHESMRFGK